MENNKAVFTTKYILENNSPITYVVHDSDGDWQFFGPEENIIDTDIRVIAFEEILAMDPSIEELLDIPAGTEAWREDKDTEWTISSEDEEES